MTTPTTLSDTAAALAEAGFIAPREEARELLARANGDQELLASLLARRLTGEPLAWITGTTTFCGLEIRVDLGVYVPRPHTEDLASRAVERLPRDGVAVDLCTGSGAVARTLMVGRPSARVVASDLDPRAVACARANGIEAYEGDLFDPLPTRLSATVDVVVGVLPYVPNTELGLLQRDTLTFESALAYDGGPDGCDILRRALAGARDWLRPGGGVLLELGGDQADALAADLERLDYGDVAILADDEGDVRGIEATFQGAGRDA